MSFGTWAKSNWLILVLSGVALVAAPTGYYFSNKMHAKLVKDHQSKAQKDLSEFSSFSVNYTVPSVRKPDEKLFEKQAPLNRKTIEFIQARRDSLKAESSGVGSEAVKLNQGEGEKRRRPLEAGVFPKYGAGNKQVSQDAMRRAYFLTAHQKMLESVGAGAPPDASRIGELLKQSKDTYTQALLAQSGQTSLTPDQDQTVKERLLTERLNMYRRQAMTLSFYADMKSFLDIPPFDNAPKDPSLATMWDWQMRYWVAADVFSAIALGNAQRAAGEPEGVAGSAVKRVLKFSVSSPPFGDIPDDPPPLDGTEAQPEAKNPVPLDPSVSVTGRSSRADNQFYDVRTCTLEAVVAPQKLPAFYDALARTNFMTVLRIDMEEYNAADDLREGYYYGDEPVAKATITIETLWLRAWTVPLMPVSVKRAMMVLEQPAATDPGRGGGGG
ncbi:MAG: hypothetical protein AB7G11_11255 [Phycisphaerales bacterium]